MIENYDLFDTVDDRKFLQYHRENPHIYDMFVKFTMQVIKRGFKHFGARGVIERIRWETYTTDKFEDLKINNNYCAGYARLFMRDHPQYNGFFRLRRLTTDTNSEVDNG